MQTVKLKTILQDMIKKAGDLEVVNALLVMIKDGGRT